jgi:D-alanyl-D-alanine carboxypeptidase
MPGYCSSLRYYPRHGVAIAFQINTDVGIVDGSTPVVEDMETRLAKVVMDGARR